MVEPPSKYEPNEGEQVMAYLKTGYGKSGMFLYWDENNVYIKGQIGDDIGHIFVIPWMNIEYLQVMREG